jgi:hypothetical protein
MIVSARIIAISLATVPVTTMTFIKFYLLQLLQIEQKIMKFTKQEYTDMRRSTW